MSKLLKLIKKERNEAFEQLKTEIDNCPNCNDYPPETYRIPFTDGKFTCCVCHSPIEDGEPVDVMLHGIKAHKYCMFCLAKTGVKHPLRYKYEFVGQIRLASFKKYGLRK